MGNPISALIELVGSKNASRSRLERRVRRIGKLNDLERVTLYKYIGSRVRAGQAVGTSLKKLLDTQYIRKTHRMKAVLEIAMHRFARGAKLASALKDFLPPTEHLLIMTGDQSGSLPDTLRELADSILRVRKMKRNFRKSIAPSLMMLLFGVLAIFGTAIYIVPRYRTVLKPKSVHGFTAFVLATSTPAGLMALIIVLALAAVFVLFMWRALSTVDARWRRILENIPNSPFAFFRDWHSLLWIKMHLIMIKSGVMERDALAQAIKESSPWLARRLTRVKQYIERDGKHLPDALIATHAQTNFPAPLLIEEIAQSGDATDISGALTRALAVWEDDFVESAETSMRVLSGAIRFGVIALLFAIAGSIMSLVLGVMHQSMAGANLF